jgi:hypothetical protein
MKIKHSVAYVKIIRKYKCIGCFDTGFYYLPYDLSTKPTFDANSNVIPRIATCYCRQSVSDVDHKQEPGSGL